jgi:hypothetical protein
MEVKSPLDFGIVDDFDALEAVWGAGFSALRASPREHPLIVVEPSFSLTPQRERQAELLFEGWGAPFLFMARAPLCQAFSVGRASALVLDIGASAARATPVVEGYVLQKGRLVSEVGGNAVCAALHEALAASGQLGEQGLQPRAVAVRVGGGGGARGAGGGGGGGASAPAAGMDAEEGSKGGGGGGVGFAPLSTGRAAGWVRRPTADLVSRSLYAALSLEVLEDVKACALHVAEIGYDPSRPPAETSYELPDGTPLRLGALREQIPELHFRIEAAEGVKHLQAARQHAGWNALQHAELLGPKRGNAPFPLQHLVQQALLACQPSVRRDLCHHSACPRARPPRTCTPTHPPTHPPTYPPIRTPPAVVLTGGGSLLSGLHKRLHWETLTLVPAAFKPRILVASPLERQFSAWVGGSILGSLGTFQQLWVSKSEYDDLGPSAVVDRCFH